MEDFLVTSEIFIKAPPQKVWDGLTNPAMVKQYMFGTDLITDWKPGSTMIWKGEWEGKAYEDKGTVLEVQPGKRLRYNYSPMGLPDVPGNYHIVTIDLTEESGGTRLSLTQDNNKTKEAMEHSGKNWGMMLDGLKKLLEGA